MVYMAEKQKLCRFPIHLRYVESRRDAFRLTLLFLLLADFAAFCLLHIGHEQKCHDPKPPKGENTQKKPNLQGTLNKSQNADYNTNQDADTAPKGFVTFHLLIPSSLYLIFF